MFNNFLLLSRLEDDDNYFSKERTEIFYDTESIKTKTLTTFLHIKNELDGCFDHTELAMHVIYEPLWRGLSHLKERGVQVKILCEITPENMSYAKKMMDISELRHLSGIRSNFGVADKKECLLHTISPENQLLSHAIKHCQRNCGSTKISI
jgi:hypothetical protein